MADPTTRAGTVPHEPKHLVVPESRVIRSLLGHDKGMGEDLRRHPVVKSGTTSAPIRIITPVDQNTWTIFKFGEYIDSEKSLTFANSETATNSLLSHLSCKWLIRAKRPCESLPAGRWSKADRTDTASLPEPHNEHQWSPTSQRERQPLRTCHLTIYGMVLPTQSPSLVWFLHFTVNVCEMQRQRKNNDWFHEGMKQSRDTGNFTGWSPVSSSTTRTAGQTEEQNSMGNLKT